MNKVVKDGKLIRVVLVGDQDYNSTMQAFKDMGSMIVEIREKGQPALVIIDTAGIKHIKNSAIDAAVTVYSLINL